MNEENYLTRAFIFIESGNWKKANEYIEKALDLAPKNAMAYLGKLMIELHIKNINEFGAITKPFDENINYKLFVKFGSKEETAQIKECAEHSRIKHINSQVKKRKSRKILKQTVFASLAIAVVFFLAFFIHKSIYPKAIYNEALTLMRDRHYAKAIKEFEKIPEYKDSSIKKDECKNLYKYSQIPDVMSDREPGNIAENYGKPSSGWHKLPFISEFIHDDILYTIYADDIGINIVSPEIKYKKTLLNYECPNVYNGKLYCYNRKNQKIVVMDIKSILCDIEKETILYDITIENTLLGSGFIFVYDDKILIRNGDTVILIDLNGDKLGEYTEKGIENAVMTSENTLAYISETNTITVLNFKTFKKKYIHIPKTSSEVKSIRAYSDKKYYLDTNSSFGNLVYDEKLSVLQEITRNGVTRGAYKDFYIGEYVLDNYEASKEPFSLKIVPSAPASINIQTGKRYNVPIKHVEAVNFGKNDKMYICGYNDDYNGDWTIYRMDLNGKNIEKIGVAKH